MGRKIGQFTTQNCQAHRSIGGRKAELIDARCFPNTPIYLFTHAILTLKPSAQAFNATKTRHFLLSVDGCWPS